MTHLGDHIKTERGEADGTPAGLRLSWAAIAIVLTVIGLVLGGLDRVRSQDMSIIDMKIAMLDAKIQASDNQQVTNRQETLTLINGVKEQMDRIEKQTTAILARWEYEDKKAGLR